MWNHQTTAQARNEVGPKLLQQGPYEDCGTAGVVIIKEMKS